MSIVLIGCAGREVRNFEGNSPEFRPEKYFDGHVKAWGFAENRWGSVTQRFEADFYGESHGDSLTMHEELRYEDGRTEERDWVITRTGQHDYTISSPDMVGEGSGQAYGNAVRWQYYLNVNVGDGKWTMWFDDWMILRNDGVMLDRAVISKYGITLGRAYIFFQKMG
ncbi:MAG: DUF3833 family protein [bacterium]